MAIKLYRYKITFCCVPFPFEVTVTARTLDSAFGKAKYMAERCGLDTGPMLEYEEIDYDRA